MEKKNKKQDGIWIDGSKAIIISINGQNEAVSEIPAMIENRVHHTHQGKTGTFMGTHHLNHERKFDERRKHQVDKFLNNVLEQVKEADELFIMGPSELKHDLKAKISGDKHLAPKLKAVETADHLTIPQCMARVRNFYKGG